MLPVEETLPVAKSWFLAEGFWVVRVVRVVVTAGVVGPGFRQVGAWGGRVGR